MTGAPQIRQALALGLSYTALGDALGISRDAARMRARRAGLRSLNRCRQKNPETLRRIQVARTMLAEGCEHDDVAQRLGMSKDAVRMMLHRAGEA
jgi:DNA-directed RNA polymerase specialized sigma24 family protein